MTRSRLLKLLLTLLLVFLPACGGTRTILVPDGTPVMLAETVKGVDVWVYDKDGQLVKGKVDLPEGWWCLADPEE